MDSIQVTMHSETNCCTWASILRIVWVLPICKNQECLEGLHVQIVCRLCVKKVIFLTVMLVLSRKMPKCLLNFMWKIKLSAPTFTVAFDESILSKSGVHKNSEYVNLNVRPGCPSTSAEAVKKIVINKPLINSRELARDRQINLCAVCVKQY